MISDLHHVHEGKRFAIVGTSPSALDYHPSYDVSIGVNGASLLGFRYNYYLIGDPHAPDREWFPISCSTSRIIANIVATMDMQLYPDYLFPSIERRAVFVAQEHYQVSNLPEPVKPHHTFEYQAMERDLILRYNNFLMYHGTITCSALQLAWMMGASSVDLYGCAFDAKQGYFYGVRDHGRVGERQVETMQMCIDVLRSAGVELTVHGKSVLK